ncbi:hypothetical protein [Polyangium mundeleinium]|uniref:Uncharacterized protein n=1 Tax=Polyangium mundeleinium TaxID=2995306 RepID=A0ABT5EWE5_9BACT|nr:hypothetical protein [Polyangium mundeleinium]MDC0746132.1 hypothetical protein [Polyangium mundeleinium]
MQRIEQLARAPVRTIWFQDGGSGHNRQEPRLTHRKPHHLFWYENYIQTKDAEEVGVSCPCNTF